MIYNKNVKINILISYKMKYKEVDTHERFFYYGSMAHRQITQPMDNGNCDLWKFATLHKLLMSCRAEERGRMILD